MDNVPAACSVCDISDNDIVLLVDMIDYIVIEALAHELLLQASTLKLVEGTENEYMVKHFRGNNSENAEETSFLLKCPCFQVHGLCMLNILFVDFLLLSVTS